MKDRRLIEETFPVKEISAESVREKSIRPGHISTLHIWWARRPLASSRATSYAALISAHGDKEEWNRKREFIIRLCKWENSQNQALIEKATREILEVNANKPPKVLDPFAGGGAIPLEALRLGCDVHAGDYNPLAALILKCTLEYPQKYGRPHEKGNWAGLKGTTSENLLEGDVRKWGTWVLDEVMNEIGQFYPNDPYDATPVGYIWTRTIPCQNPGCRADIPLMRQFWLVKKGKKKVALYPEVSNGDVTFKLMGVGYERLPSDFDPSRGTVSRAVANCLVCGSSIDAKTTRKLFKEGKAGQRMVAVVLNHPQRKGKTYRVSTEEDFSRFQNAGDRLKDKRERLLKEWGFEPVPDEMVPTPSHDVDRLPMYGMTTWGDVFNPRQKLALITFADKVRKAHKKMLERDYEAEYAKAVASYLAIAVDRLADYNSVICRWAPHGEYVGNTFTRQAIPMIWDYIELNPFSGSTGDWKSALGWILKVIQHVSTTSSVPAKVTQWSATDLPYSDSFFDAVLTDPPYYDNVGYANLSDFFYVWLKRTVGHLHPELFSTPVTPKTNEIVSDPQRQGGKRASQKFFEDMLKKSFQEIHRVLRPGGMAVIVYAHKSTEGWETLINSLLDSGLIMTGAWPLHTEMKTRIRAKETASLASSIYIVARKMQREPTGFYTDVKDELKNHLNGKLARLWEEGIGGADFFIAAIGSAIEVFGKYEKVMDFEGNIVRADKLLDDVRKIATDYAVRQILHNGFGGEISDLTRLYVLWRWEFGEARVPFDDARKLAQSCGVDLSLEWNRDGFIRKDKEFIRLLSPHERDIERLADSHELTDILHLALLHWEKGKREDMAQVISDSGFGQSEAFYRVAQAISETLPNESKEKKLLDGFLAGRERVREEVRDRTVQTRLM